MSKMYLMIGAPGSGKSTYIKNHAQPDDIIISRDVIRYSMVDEKEYFFSKEKKVYQELLKRINHAISLNTTFYVDQTSLNRKSRKGLLDQVCHRPDTIIAVYIKKSLSDILSQNALRTGRAFVPETAVINMFAALEEPTFDEDFDEIWVIEEDGNEKHLQRN